MGSVDPRLNQIPKELLQDFEVRNYFEQLERFLHDLWVRTGGGTDAIADADVQELYSWRTPGEEQSQFIAAYANKGASKEFEVIEIPALQSTYTTRGNEIVICNNTVALTVILNPAPDHKERAIIVRNQTGNVSVTSSKSINGETTKKILRRYTSIDHIFTTEADSWSVI